MLMHHPCQDNEEYEATFGGVEREVVRLGLYVVHGEGCSGKNEDRYIVVVKRLGAHRALLSVRRTVCKPTEGSAPSFRGLAPFVDE